ncbi:cystathionine beta-lyase [Streptococcus equinus]|uniref:cystathionine beta-lyase n=1 Tax=Streptococcus equinus TaxID=1335 RepID=UPI00237AE2B1|nr:cystathionine beta-lyase [Streptococcus equinus]
MTDYISLALKYGGFTSLDKVYLKNTLEDLTDAQKLSFITPPPSVINAYFAEMYQKQSPQAATDYYFELSKELDLLNDNPSFDEHKPFIRLNLSGKSYGFTYENDKEVARVFSEKDEALTTDVLFELAQVFPQYKVYVEADKIKMSKMDFDDEELEDLTPESSLLSHVSKLKGNMVKLKSFNRDELSDLLAHYKGQVYYTFDQREFIAYVKVTK